MVHHAPCLFTQLHSGDYRLRMSLAQLESLRLAHLCTVMDPSVLEDARELQPLCGGWTEWTADHQGRAVSLAWDWVALADGAIQAVPRVPPRTNLQVVDGKGYDLCGGAHDRALMARVGALRWAAAVRAGVGAALAAV